ncbi:MAG: IS110 family transposase [Nitrospirae bacterium]|nr:IS110 family transposase [Nitrospirota bacterium]MBI3593921.1 IS110 family transposase [Nitrospirota bacterium]
MEITTLGIDLAKLNFQLHGINHYGKVVLTKKVTRNKLLEVVAKLPCCLIGMEACASSHYWAREFERFGHQVKLMSPRFVKPYVKTNKNDFRDAEAICEAVTRPTMRFVPIKTVEQEDIQALHRSRSLLIKNRTALINQIRGLLAEYGLVIPKSAAKVRPMLIRILENQHEQLTSFGRETFFDLYDQLVDLEKRIEKMHQRLEVHFKKHPVCQKIAAIPGIGQLTATALLAAVSYPQAFKNGRHLSAWLGLVPRQYSSGGKEVLGKLSKRGNRYLRTLLIHGARAVVYRSENKKDSLSLWTNNLKRKKGTNVAAVALANKNARVVWALLAHDDIYRKAA